MPVQKLNRAIMYRAYPTPEQQVLLSKTFGCVRFVWNHMLMDAQQFLNEAGKFFIPTPAKYKKEFPFLKEVDSLALANTQLDLKEARKKHREDPKSCGAPKLKSKRKSKMSYTTNWCCTIKVDIENSKGQYIEKDKQEATKDGSESTKIQHGI